MKEGKQALRERGLAKSATQCAPETLTYKLRQPDQLSHSRDVHSGPGRKGCKKSANIFIGSTI